MYIEKYWGDYIGGSDDSMTLMEYFTGKQGEIVLGEIFSDIGIDKLGGNYRETDGLSAEIDGIEAEFQYAISVIADLAALLLECKVNGSVKISELWEDCDDGAITITATQAQHDIINEALKDFAESPTSYDLAEMMDENELQEMAEICSELRAELYE